MLGGYRPGAGTASHSPATAAEWRQTLASRMLTAPVPSTKGESKEELKKSIREAVFGQLKYGDCPESPAGIEAWLDQFPNRRVGMFINGTWVHAGQGSNGAERTYTEVVAPADKRVIAYTANGTREDVEAAVQAAKEAQVKWAALAPSERARHLYAIARHIQKHARLLAVLESLDNGKPFRESKNFDVPTIARHFYNHAGWAMTAPDELLKKYKPVGVVAAVIPWNFPLMLLTWKVAAALATGNTVVVKPAPWTFLTALLLANICAEAGLPPGVFNVVTGDMTPDGHIGSLLAAHPDVSKLAFTGSTAIGRRLRKLLAGSGKKISLELGGKNPFIVFPEADLDSASEGVVEAIWFNQGQVCCAGSRVLVHESVYERFVAKVKRRMRTLKLGHSLEKDVDIGPLIAEFHLKHVASYVEAARKEGADVYQVEDADVPKNGFFFPPTLITNISSESKCVREEIFGPVVTVQTFETLEQAVNMANDTMYGLGASVWTENINTAIEVAHSLEAGTVWVNCHSVFDAEAPFGGYKQSGFGRDCGAEGLYEYVKLKWQNISTIESYDPSLPPPEWPAATESTPADRAIVVTPVPTPSAVPASEVDPASPRINRTLSRRVSLVTGIGMPDQLDQSGAGSPGAVVSAAPAVRTSPIYYDGRAQKSQAISRIGVVPEGEQPIGFIAECSRADVEAAINSASSARAAMRKLTAEQRALALYELADAIEENRAALVQWLQGITGRTGASCVQEVLASIQRLRYYAARADKFGGKVKEASFNGLVYTLHEPLGVCAAVCPEDYPILGFVSLVAPLISRGNSVVAVPSTNGALAIVEMFRCLDVVFSQGTLPAGAINVLTGSKEPLTRMLVESRAFASIWYHGSLEGSRCVEYYSADEVTRTWVNYGRLWEWTNPEVGQGLEYLRRASEVKTVWVPMGDGQP